ncbi:alkaline phosphatase-like protein [Basidiobolus meristosporus CBS 931.73]|uniref:Alkaline phosphatase-like protein n=1 Tax=Basidiobolus meristosporus CBS 931.73 TaxID=1314790 RepID=A0A1Y1XM73_9FUNG|nr:alkaline phosphatase-like protein [Basidiobolus meristosporus CBS 931.73]|eukprot:ORX86860.1 alkaline phosphatase-like protein [Basidiobolus meristosporus CBS 931.73]
MTITFYRESETLINWYTMRDMLANVTAAQAGMAVHDLPLLVIMSLGLLALWLFFYFSLRYQMSRTSASQPYMPVHNKLDEIAAIEEAFFEETLYSEPKHSPNVVKLSWSRETLLLVATKRNAAYGLLTALLLTYIVLCLTIRPSAPWSELDSNFGAKALCIMLIYPHVANAGSLNITGFKYDATNEFVTKFSSMRVGRNSTMQDQDFDFLRRSQNSTIKNVVFMILETTRNDIVPFDYFSEFSERLEPKLREEQRNQTRNPSSAEGYESGISPFFEDLMRRGGFYMPYTKSLSGYTLKSLTTTHCGMMPLRTPGASERTHPFYQTCLPELLKKHSDYGSAYFQTSDGGFDNQRNLMQKFGFDLVLDKQLINGGELDQYDNIPRLSNGKFEEINYFGYEDEIIIPKMVDWIGEQKDANKPFFLTHLNNAAHHPYGQPKSWNKIDYLEKADGPVNDYLNSIRYVDGFMKDFLASFEKAHPKTYQETLFMFVGDHGVSLREHHIMHAHQNPYEYAFNVPLMFYSPNGGVQEYLKQQFRLNLIEKDGPEAQQDGRLQTLYQRGATNLVLGNWTNLDILPTMLNLLKEDPEAEQGAFDYEGSSITGPSDPMRITMSLATPGGFSTTLRYGTHKLLKFNDGSMAYYDLYSDPTELQPRQINDLSPELHEWAVAADRVSEIWNTNINKAYHFLHSA